MALPKESVNINFAQGLDTKTDPKQVSAGKFLSLSNTIFQKGGLLQKRNGFAQLTELPDNLSNYLTTFNGNLTAVGTSINAFSQGNNEWVSRGNYYPVSVSELPVMQTETTGSSSTVKTVASFAISSNNLVCTVYNGSKFVVADLTTGQNVIEPTSVDLIDIQVFTLGGYFIIVGADSVVNTTLAYIPVNFNTLTIGSKTTITTDAYYSSGHPINFVGASAATGATTAELFVSWFNNSIGGVSITSINDVLQQGATVRLDAGHGPGVNGSYFGITIDQSTQYSPQVYVIYAGLNEAFRYFVVDKTLVTLHAPTSTGIKPSTDIGIADFPFSRSLSAIALNGYCIVFGAWTMPNISFQLGSLIGQAFYPLTFRFDFMAGSASPGISGYAYNSFPYSLPVVKDNKVYINLYYVNDATLTSVAYAYMDLVKASAYSFQSCYILNVTTAEFTSSGASFIPISRVSYGEAQTYVVSPCMSGTLIDNVFYSIGVLSPILPTISSGINVQNSTSNQSLDDPFDPSGHAILYKFNLGNTAITSVELGNNLNLSGGFLWSYDGVTLAEQNFLTFPCIIEVYIEDYLTPIPPFGIQAGVYFYQAIYEWTDNQGNIIQSTPSVPVQVDLSTLPMGHSADITIKVNPLWYTNKDVSNVKVNLYRYSIAQPIYYLVQSVTLSPAELQFAISLRDIRPDSTILGTPILYTTGGVVEDSATPPTNILSIFKSRLFAVNAEDPNQLLYSKQVIEGTPVEMSDLFTIFVPPTTSNVGSTGEITALSPMDDKLIIFKRDAMFYLTGIGPDNTGANNDFTDPIFITSVAGCSNPNSIVGMPIGIMFQSDKGIWLLGRDLSTRYIGAPVEQFTQFNEDLGITPTVKSALLIPGTNQVRFNLDTGVVLMYDYYYDQWGTFTGIPGISSTLYQNLHTYLNEAGAVFQETPNLYMDGPNPVNFSFTTSWLNFTGVQGYERSYYFYLIGQFLSPHKLIVDISYDYNTSPEQRSIINPVNYTPNWGGNPLWGDGDAWGGSLQYDLEQWRVFLRKQKCQAFRITISEQFDPQFNTTPGAGLTLSGLNLVIGKKKGYPVRRQNLSVG